MYKSRLTRCYRALNGCFSSPRGTVLNLTMKKLCKWLVVVAKCLDNMNGDPSKYESSTLLNPILRAFNISLAERTPYTAPDQLLKKQVSLDLGNYLFRLYAKVCFYGFYLLVALELNSIISFYRTNWHRQYTGI
jgi:hypothetical protein